MNIEHFHAFGKNILVQLLAPEEKTTGGILLAPESRKKEPIGTVISAGFEAVKDICVGDIVYFNKGIEIHEGYYLITIDDILGVMWENEIQKN